MRYSTRQSADQKTSAKYITFNGWTIIQRNHLECMVIQCKGGEPGSPSTIMVFERCRAYMTGDLLFIPYAEYIFSEAVGIIHNVALFLTSM